jgi:muramoyltetrapeptide carboxypeptidase
MLMKPAHVLKPRRLRKGDLIGIVSPASAPSAAEKIEKGVRYLESLGYRTLVGDHVLDEHGYLAGTDADRIADLNGMLRNRRVRAIIATRGGYGTPRILGRVDYAALRADPKILVGYSDLTALQLAAYRKTGLITFSGPMLAVELWEHPDAYTEEHFWRAVTRAEPIGPLVNPPEEPSRAQGKGVARGRLLGGNMALYLSLLGTPYAPDLTGNILVLEDVDEAPHRVDRMFAQLDHAGVLRRISGLVLGRFTDCVPSDPSKPFLTIEQVLAEVKERLNVPLLENLQYGHLPRKLTLPLGARCRLDARSGVLEVLESAVRG